MSNARHSADISLRPARIEDCRAVVDLLAAVHLPPAGASEHWSRFWVAARAGEVLGCAGTEHHEDALLLRSVAVHPSAQGQGLAERLCLQVLEDAAAQGFPEAYLLTTTAEGFFARFGFARVPRSAAPRALRSSPEFQGACPDTAVLMRLALRRPLPWVRRAGLEDVAAITRIHNQGIADRIATLDESPKTEDERYRWLMGRSARHPVLIAVAAGEVVGWASLNPFSAREAYRHVADLSVYVAREARATGVGTLLLGELIRRARQLGYHKLLLTAFPFNEAGMALYAKMGFQAVGVLHEQGTLDGRWVDTIMMEQIL